MKARAAKRVKILGYSYTLRADRPHEKLEASGRLLPSRLHLEIASDMCKAQKISTVLHEILEGLKHHLSLKISHDDIERLETGLFTVLTDNGVNLSPLIRKPRKRDAQ